jgi:hypothetical protein
VTGRISIMGGVIAQLRKSVPAFAGRVAGAAEFQRGLLQYNASMLLPAAYVLPVSQESPGNENMVGVFQFVRRTIGVAVEFDASNDRRGQAPAMDYDDIEGELLHALLNFNPDPCHMVRGLWLLGGNILDLDRARLFYQWEFTAELQFWDSAGAPLLDRDPSAEWLKDITVDVSPPDHAGDVVTRVLTTPATWDTGSTEWDAGATEWS